jgi:hypothetical protein
MKRLKIPTAALVLLLPVLASGGEVAHRNVPTLGEAGLVVLGIGLAVAGAATFLFKKRR